MHWENRGWQGKKRGCYFCFDPNKDAISWLKVAEIWCCVDLLLPQRVRTIVEFIFLLFFVFFTLYNSKQFIHSFCFISNGSTSLFITYVAYKPLLIKHNKCTNLQHARNWQVLLFKILQSERVQETFDFQCVPKS